MPKKTLVLIILMITILTGGTFADTKKAPEQVFEAEYLVWVKNGSKQTENLIVTVPLPKNHPPHQKILKLDYSPKPRKIIKTNSENKAVFLIKDLPAGKKAYCKISIKVENRRTAYFIKPEKVTSAVPKSVSPFLKSTNRFPAKDPQVRKILRTIVGNEQNRYYKALLIYDYIRSFNFKMSGKPKKVREVLRQKECQCSDAAEVFVTLCRAAGIPTRYVGGVFLKESKRSTPDTHAWAEIWLSPYGWLPVDPTMGRFTPYTRLSRFSEIDTPYLLLWKDRTNPFSISTQKGQKLPSGITCGNNVTYKALKERKGFKITDFDKSFTFNLKKESPPDVSSKTQKANELFKKAVASLKKKKKKEAENYLFSSIKADPDFIPPYINLIRIYEDKGRLAGLPNKLAGYERKGSRGAVFALGIIYTRLQKYSKAQKRFTAIENSSINPYYTNLYMGEFYLDTRQISKATIHLNKALRIYPGGFQTYNYLYELLYYLGDFSSVVKLSDTGFKITSGAIFQDEKARALMIMKRYPEAAKSAKKAVQMAPHNGSYLGILGRIHIKMGQKQKGKKEIRKALKLGVPPADREILKSELKS